MLGLKVGVVQGPRLLEHILSEGAFIKPRRRDGTDLVKAAGFQRLRQHQCLACALDIALALALRTGLHVVNGREVKKVVYLARVLAYPGGLHAQAWLAEVALHRHHLTPVCAPELTQPVHLGQRARPHQQVDTTTTIQ